MALPQNEFARRFAPSLAPRLAFHIIVPFDVSQPHDVEGLSEKKIAPFGIACLDYYCI